MRASAEDFQVPGEPEAHTLQRSGDKTGNRQLKNAFDIMSKGTHSNKFLFVWDCDSIGLVDKVIETDKFFKYCFEKNTENAKADKGIENLYSESFFSEDVYDERNTKIEYGGTKTEKIFKKNKFLEKIKKESSADCFQKFKPLVIKIREII